MRYVNAHQVLPELLLRELQQYVQGEFVYIPCPAGTKKAWGEASGGRQYLYERNRNIREQFRSGSTLDELAEAYCLSRDTVRKIVYNRKQG